MRPARLAVVLVAHGSRDPRAALATEALARAVGAACPRWDVRASYLDHSVPRPRQVLGDFAARGHRRAVLVPLLLTAAYHGRVDVPGETLLLDALETRLREAGAAALDAVVLTAAGTRDARARASVEQVAAALGAGLGLPCRVAYASAAPPVSGDAVAELRAEGHERVGLASYFLAPGLLYDATAASAREAGAVAVAEPLTDIPDLAQLVAGRVRAAARQPAACAA